MGVPRAPFILALLLCLEFGGAVSSAPPPPAPPKPAAPAAPAFPGGPAVPIVPTLPATEARDAAEAAKAAAKPKPVAAVLPPEFGERIDVRAVDVEVVVTDAKGQRVRGLTVADFKLLVDGREERIDSFAEVKEGQTAPSTPTAEPAARAALPGGIAAGGRVGTSYLVFLDDAFCLANQRNAVLATLRSDLALLGPGDRMAVVAFDGRGLTVLSGWTAEVAALEKAFTAAAGRKAYGDAIVAGRRADRRAQATTAEDLDESVDLLRANGWDLEEIRALGQHAGGIGRAAVAAADALRGLPLPAGRRVMMLLAGGWPWDGDPRTLRPLTTAANLLGYTLYPVNVPGSDPLSEIVDADTEGGDGVTTWQQLSELALQSLARATGGVAALNRDHAFRQVVEDARSYYWLGFSPIWKADDRPHSIRIEVRRPGLTARGRSRFYDLSHATSAVMTAESILSVGGDPARKRLGVTAGAMKLIDETTMELPLVFAVPAETLIQLPQGATGYPVEGNLSIASMDSGGGRGVLPGRALRVTLPAAPHPGVVVRFHSVLKLSRTRQRLVFTVNGADGDPVWNELEVKP
jgi:VWFA-related protein